METTRIETEDFILDWWDLGDLIDFTNELTNELKMMTY